MYPKVKYCGPKVVCEKDLTRNLIRSRNTHDEILFKYRPLYNACRDNLLSFHIHRNYNLQIHIQPDDSLNHIPPIYSIAHLTMCFEGYFCAQRPSPSLTSLEIGSLSCLQQSYFSHLFSPLNRSLSQITSFCYSSRLRSSISKHLISESSKAFFIVKSPIGTIHLRASGISQSMIYSFLSSSYSSLN